MAPRCTVACTNIEKIDKMVFEGKTKTRCGGTLQIANMHWPWGAGMFATSLGPDDACFVAGANWHKNSGLMCVWGQVCAVQKEFIEATKTLGSVSRLDQFHRKDHVGLVAKLRIPQDTDNLNVTHEYL